MDAILVERLGCDRQRKSTDLADNLDLKSEIFERFVKFRLNCDMPRNASIVVLRELLRG